MIVKQLVEMVVMEDHRVKQRIPVKMDLVEKDLVVKVSLVDQQVLQ